MTITYPYIFGKANLDLVIICVDKRVLNHLDLLSCGYPYKYFKRK